MVVVESDRLVNIDVVVARMVEVDTATDVNVDVAVNVVVLGAWEC